jgi:hypothetical protein
LAMWAIGRAGASHIRRLITLISVGWRPPDWPPSGACLTRGTSAPVGLVTPSRVAPVVRKNCITSLDTILPTCEHRRRRSPVLKDALAMMRSPHLFRHLVQFPCILLTLLGDIMRFLRLCLRPSAALAAENLFLRKQLALYQARQIQPRRVTNATRSALVWLARWCNWRQALVIVQP